MEKIKVVISEVLEKMKSGISRKDIAEELGLNALEKKQLFEHPTLKGVRVTKAPVSRLIFVDEVEETTPEPALEVEATEEIAWPGKVLSAPEKLEAPFPVAEDEASKVVKTAWEN